jgi:acyl-CoA synthetase (NDP forming)
MNIHEYQAKELLQRFNVATTRGKVVSTLDEAEQVARALGDVSKSLLKRRFTLVDAAKERSRMDLRAGFTFARPPQK